MDTQRDGQEPLPPNESKQTPRYIVMPEQFLALTRSRDGVTVEQPRPAPYVPPQVPQAQPAPASRIPSARIERPAPDAARRRFAFIWGGVFAIVLIGGGIAAWLVVRSLPPTEPPPLAPVEPPPTAEIPEPPAPPAPQNDVQPEEPVIPAPPAPITAPDTDGDDLSDIEEELFGLRADEQDSDGDGYVDALELINLYNPAARTPAALLDAGLVYRYTHEDEGWSIFIPRPWIVVAAELAQRSVTIATELPTERVVATVHENDERMALGTFISQRPDGKTLAPIERVAVKSGLVGLRYADEKTRVWFPLGPSRVLEIVYESDEVLLPFSGTFEMMLQSFTHATAPSRR
ncbi:MAG: hypothetical protein Q7S96_02740 [bacterium]|nr:hypothetical protein [bacterium]